MYFQIIGYQRVVGIICCCHYNCIIFVFQITDVGLSFIAANNPCIDTLNLRHCQNISDKGISALALSLKRLKYIDLQVLVLSNLFLLTLTFMFYLLLNLKC